MINKIENLSIDQIKIPSWTGNIEDLMFNEKLCNSIKKNGQLENVIVREIKRGFELIDGRQRIRALKKLNISQVICINIGNINEEEAKLIYLQSKIVYKTDSIAIAKLLISLKNSINIRDIAKVTGLTAREIQTYQKLFDFAFDKYEQKQKKKPKSFF